jgi:hypothetical protein
MVSARAAAAQARDHLRTQVSGVPGGVGAGDCGVADAATDDAGGLRRRVVDLYYRAGAAGERGGANDEGS